MGGVSVGREALLRATRADDALLLHESRHLVASAVEAATPGGLREFAPSVDAVVLLPEGRKGRSELLIAQFARRGWTGLAVVVGAGGDVQLCTDRLDPPSTPTGLAVPVGVDERNYFCCRRSSSAPKKDAAACKMSLARRSSRFSLRNLASSACSSVVRPGR